MVGTTQGPAGKPYRYYCIRSSQTTPSSDRLMRSLIRAEPVESAVLAAVRDALMQPGLREQVIELIDQQSTVLVADAENLERLQRERQQINEQLEFVIDELGTLGKDAARRKIRQLENKLAALDDRIRKITATAPMSPEQKAQLAGRIIAQIRTMAECFYELPLNALRELLASMITKLEIDLETRALSIEIASPAAVVTASTLAWVSKSDVSKRMAWRPNDENLRISTILDCEHVGRSGYECRRRAA